tara:strand:- start:1807 stop:2481 length:675 start_codon:yes stop_codon:yes gene_type:complete
MIERNMSKYKIYSATKGKKEDSLLYKSLSIDYYDIPTLYKENNTQSLQKTYNEFLDDAYDNDVDIACFIHDDVFVNCNDLLYRLQNSVKKYTVFGVAGSVSCKVKEPALWHLMSGREDHRGNVAHGDQTSYSYTSFGPLPSRALVLDGVFLGININKFNKKARFDETYPSQFHYYDIDFCLECNKNGIIMGVVDIPIIHSSPGLTDPNKQFYEGQKYFINKWKK